MPRHAGGIDFRPNPRFEAPALVFCCCVLFGLCVCLRLRSPRISVPPENIRKHELGCPHSIAFPLLCRSVVPPTGVIGAPVFLEEKHLEAPCSYIMSGMTSRKEAFPHRATRSFPRIPSSHPERFAAQRFRLPTEPEQKRHERGRFKDSYIEGAICVDDISPISSFSLRSWVHWLLLARIHACVQLVSRTKTEHALVWALARSQK